MINFANFTAECMVFLMNTHVPVCVCITIIKGLLTLITIAIFYHPKFADNTCIYLSYSKCKLKKKTCSRLIKDKAFFPLFLPLPIPCPNLSMIDRESIIRVPSSCTVSNSKLKHPGIFKKLKI